MRGLSQGGVYLIIGVIVAAVNDYFDDFETLEGGRGSADRDRDLPLVLFGVDINLNQGAVQLRSEASRRRLAVPAAGQVVTRPEVVSYLAKRLDPSVDAETSASATFSCLQPAGPSRRGAGPPRGESPSYGFEPLRHPDSSWEPATSSTAGGPCTAAFADTSR